MALSVADLNLYAVSRIFMAAMLAMFVVTAPAGCAPEWPIEDDNDHIDVDPMDAYPWFQSTGNPSFDYIQPPPSWRTDLRYLWSEDSIRDQGMRGSCHSFATVALIEAAIAWDELFATYSEAERHQQLLRGHVDLAEQDLFHSFYFHGVGRGETDIITKSLVEEGLSSWDDPNGTSRDGASAGNILNASFYIGVPLESSVPYTYADWESFEGSRWLEINEWIDATNKASWEAYNESPFSYIFTKKKRLRKMAFEKISPLVDEIARRWVVQTNQADAQRERARVVDRLERFAIVEKSYRRREHETACSDLRNQVEQYHLPALLVIRAYENFNISYYDEGDMGEGAHGVTFAGWIADDGGPTAILRNSWDAPDYDRVPMDEMCKEVRAAYFLVPRDAIPEYDFPRDL